MRGMAVGFAHESWVKLQFIHVPECKVLAAYSSTVVRVPAFSPYSCHPFVQLEFIVQWKPMKGCSIFLFRMAIIAYHGTPHSKLQVILLACTIRWPLVSLVLVLSVSPLQVAWASTFDLLTIDSFLITANAESSHSKSPHQLQGTESSMHLSTQLVKMQLYCSCISMLVIRHDKNKNRIYRGCNQIHMQCNEIHHQI